MFKLPFNDLSSNKCNAMFYVPEKKIYIVLYKKKQKYVSLDEGAMKTQCKGLVDRCMSVFRPKTPPGMCRVVEKFPIFVWNFTLYKKRRTDVSTYKNSFDSAF